MREGLGEGEGGGEGHGRRRGRFLVFHFLSSYITLCSTRHQINNGPTYPILSQPEQVRAVCTLRVLCARCLLVSPLYFLSPSPFLFSSPPLPPSFSLHPTPLHTRSFPLFPLPPLWLFRSVSYRMCDTVENSKRVTNPSMNTGTP